MARRLDRMLQPGERVVCRVTTPWRDYIVPCLSVVAGVVLAGIIMWLLFRPEGRRFWFLILFVAAMIPGQMILVPGLWRATAVVTDRRVIHARGFIRPRVVEMPIARIAALDMTPERLTLIDDSAETLDLYPAPRVKELAAAIAAAAGLSAPAEAADGA